MGARHYWHSREEVGHEGYGACCILVTEDDAEAAELLANCLESNCCVVDLAANGEESLRRTETVRVW